MYSVINALRRGARSTRIFGYELYYRHLLPPLLIRPGTTDRSAFRQIFVDREYDIAFPQNPKIIVDAGANVGYASLWFAHHFPEADIIAIEPEKKNFETLCANVAPYPRIRPVWGAVWNWSGHVVVRDTSLGAWGFTVEECAASDEHAVPAMTIGDIMRANGHECIDILKIDIEGSERELFSSPNTDSWLGSVKAIVIELHDRMRPGSSATFYTAVLPYNFLYGQRGENIVLIRE